MSKIEKFPKEIFVTIQEDGDDGFLSIDSEATTVTDAFTEKENTRVATYQLVKINEGKIEGIVTAEITE